MSLLDLCLRSNLGLGLALETTWLAVMVMLESLACQVPQVEVYRCGTREAG